MTKRFPYAASIATIVLLALFAAFAAAYAPTGSHLADYWSDDGVAIRFDAPWAALFVPVGLCALSTLVLAALSRSLGTDRQLVLFIFALMIVYEAMVAAPVFGIVIPGTISPIVAVCGLFYISLGNQRPKWRPVPFGPQTLKEINRRTATARFAGRIWVLSGLVLLAAGLVPLGPATRHIVVKPIIWIVILAPVLYSALWRQDRSSADGDDTKSERPDAPPIDG